MEQSQQNTLKYKVLSYALNSTTRSHITRSRNELISSSQQNAETNVAGRTILSSCE